MPGLAMLIAENMSCPLSRLLSRKSFRVLAFGILLLLLVFSYWLGNQFKKEPRPGVEIQAEKLSFQARLLAPPEPIADIGVEVQGARILLKRLVDDWVFILPGRLEMDLNRRLAQAWNHLALEPRIQSRMRVWLLDETDVPLPDFIRPLRLSAEERTRAAEVFAEGGLYLLNPKGELRASFDPNQSAASIAHDFQHVLDSSTP